MKDNHDRISYTSHGEVRHQYKDPASLTLGQGLIIVAIAIVLVGVLAAYFGFNGIMLW